MILRTVRGIFGEVKSNPSMFYRILVNVC